MVSKVHGDGVVDTAAGQEVRCTRLVACLPLHGPPVRSAKMSRRRQKRQEPCDGYACQPASTSGIVVRPPAKKHDPHKVHM